MGVGSGAKEFAGTAGFARRSQELTVVFESKKRRRPNPWHGPGAAQADDLRRGDGGSGGVLLVRPSQLSPLHPPAPATVSPSPLDLPAPPLAPLVPDLLRGVGDSTRGDCLAPTRMYNEDWSRQPGLPAEWVAHLIWASSQGANVADRPLRPGRLATHEVRSIHCPSLAIHPTPPSQP
ncbi:hypothetical protein E2562_035044 [Oryza meyeriana var. granulata]|uniref:Uncharacterized protein n=1 Tax=Oryza meyeriana var. granulata TaxID=110450 RepID=A0A6G1BQE6_9ORYZ|nr:hypothetical protein E2562_035044 [Oryza meyeriana var. granulata]